MDIEFWSDIVCPYCGLMDHRLRRAVEDFPHGAEVRVIHRSFQLHPDLPREGVTQRALFPMHGMPESDGEGILRPIEEAAEAEGLSPYHALDRTLGPTDLAHELLAFATDQGRGEEIWSAMFRAHFGQARKLWTAEQVLGFAAEMGLDREEAAEVLRDRRYRKQVRADQRDAERLGARGVPFLVLDGRYTIPGAVEMDSLVSALSVVWEESHPAPLPMATGAGGMCGPDACAVPDPPK